MIKFKLQSEQYLIQFIVKKNPDKNTGNFQKEKQIFVYIIIYTILGIAHCTINMISKVEFTDKSYVIILNMMFI